MKESQDDMCNFLILYFQSRNCHHWKYVGYKQFRALMVYITGIKDIGEIRNLFERMVKMGYFKKRKISGKTDYMFQYHGS